MKLLRLETYNLASLEGRNTIDFEKGILGESNIFCIVGPTGSGKSTLLDAICLPLYGKAPRYTPKGKINRKIAIYGTPDEEESNRLSPTDPRNILTRGKKQCYAKLTFLANDGKLYRAEWSDEFRVKRYANAKNALYLLTKDDAGGMTEEERDWRELQQVIGLDYNQFLRTVLIAQGDFAEFLNADDETRCDLLEKLVGNQGIYTTITDRIKDHADTAKKSLEQLKADNASMEKDLLPQEQYDESKARLEELRDKECARQKALKETEAQLKWYVDEKRLTQVKQKMQERLAGAQQRCDAIKQEEEQLSLHDNTVEAVATYRKLTDALHNEGNLRTTQQSQRDRERKLQAGTALKEETHQKLTVLARQAAQTVETEKPKIDQAKAMVVQLESLRQETADKQKRLSAAQKALRTAERQVTDNKSLIKQAQAEVAAQGKALTQLQQEKADKQRELDQTVAENTQAFEAERARTERLDADAMQKDKDKADQKVTDLARATETLSKIAALKQKTANEQKLRSDKLARITEIDRLLKKLNSSPLELEVETLTKSYTLMTSENWEQHRDMLHDGEPCPLCGAKAHPYHDKAVADAVISEHKKLLDRKKAELNDQQERARMLGEEKAGHMGQVKQLAEVIRDDERELATQQATWHSLATAYPHLPEDAARLDALLASARRDATAASGRLTAYHELAKRIDTLRSQKEKAEKEAATFKEDAAKELDAKKTDCQKTQDRLTRLLAQTDGLASQQQKAKEDWQTALAEQRQAADGLKKKEQALHDLMKGVDPAAYEQQINKEKEKADKAADDAKVELDRLHNDMSKLKGQAEQVDSQMAQLQQSIATQRKALTEEIANANRHLSSTITEAVVQELAAKGTDWEEMRKRHKTLHDDRLTARTQCETARKDLELHGKTKPEKSEEALMDDQARLGKADYTDDMKELSFRLHKHDEAAKAVGDQKEKLEKAARQYAEWRELLEAIGGSEGKTLRKVVQSYTLRFLVAHANAEIRRFNSRYELKQVKNSLALRVIDHDRGNDERDTTSLSGGETFIVSLGLALGLSSLSSRNISFGNLFIDEGFGTLDPDSLATVIDALSCLQTSQGKKVGVISHTDTMAERIATQVRVIKEGNTGASRIEIV